jgi:hypothetical protein
MWFWNSLIAQEIAAVVSALVLAIGAVVEYWPKINALTLLALKWILRKTTPFDRCAFRKLLVHSVGPILVVVGIGGEFIFEGRTFVLSNRLEQKGENDVAALKERASANEKDAAAFRKQADELEKHNAELEKQNLAEQGELENERLSRAKVEAAVAFRSLNDRQKHDIGIALSRFANITAASMWYENGSAEGESFADDIAEALRAAHIHTTTVGGVMSMREGGGNWDKPIEPARTGVEIASTNNPVAHELAAALLNEISSRGFDVERREDQVSKDNKPPGPIIWVTVLLRPKGPQGEYKLQAEWDAKAKNK